MNDLGVGWWILFAAIGAIPFVAAYYTGKSAEPSPSTVPPGSNDPNADCATACTQFEQARQQRCKARLAEATAQSEMDARRSDYNGALALWGALTAAAAAAFLFVPWPANLIVGGAMSLLATAAALVMLFWAGKLQTASDAWTAAAQALADANDVVLGARTIIFSTCSMDAATACLNIPDAC